jgi:hypothetical protein
MVLLFLTFCWLILRSPLSKRADSAELFPAATEIGGGARTKRHFPIREPWKRQIFGDVPQSLFLDTVGRGKSEQSERMWVKSR